MERNNIRAAIEIEDFDKCREEWEDSVFNDGRTNFYSFITNPTAEREAFILSLGVRVEFSGAVAATKI